MIRFLFALALLGLGNSVFAGPANSAKKIEAAIETIPSYEEFRNLSLEDKALYIRSLQNLMVRLNTYENEQGRSVSEVQLFHQLLLSSAVAASNQPGGPCIYAGHVMTFAANGLCPRAPRGSCEKGQVQCNPVVFGEGVCTAPSQRVTSNCLESARPIKEIVASLEKNPEQWSKLSSQLSSYCSKTGTQGAPCRIIQSRLIEVKKGMAVKNLEETPQPDGTRLAPLPPVRPSNLDAAVKPPAPTPTPAPAAQQAPANVVKPDEISKAQGVPTAAPESSEPPAPPEPPAKISQKVRTGACYPHFLIDSKTKCGNELEYHPYITVKEMDEIFCKKGGISKEKDKEFRARFTAAQNCIRSEEEAKGVATRIDSLRVKKAVEFPLKNYEACVEALKQNTMPKAENNGSMTLNGEELTIQLKNGKSVKTQQRYATYYLVQLSEKKNGAISPCDLTLTPTAAKTIAPPDANPGQSQSGAH